MDYNYYKKTWACMCTSNKVSLLKFPAIEAASFFFLQVFGGNARDFAELELTPHVIEQ